MLRSRPIRSTTTTGFSLIELILVVVIIGIMAAMALPRFGSSTQRYRVELAARKLAADIAWCRQAARSSGQTATLTFNAATSTYTLSGGVSVTGSTVPDLTVDLTKAPFNVNLSAVTLNLAGTLTPTTAISFDTSGIPSSEGTITLSTNTITRKLSLSSPGGAVSVE